MESVEKKIVKWKPMREYDTLRKNIYILEKKKPKRHFLHLYTE